MVSAKAKAKARDAYHTRSLKPITSKPHMPLWRSREQNGYAICAAKRVIDAVRGSKAMASFMASGWRWAIAGLNEIRLPTIVGARTTGMHQ